MRIRQQLPESRVLTTLLLCGTILATSTTLLARGAVEVQPAQTSEKASDPQRSARRILHFAAGGTLTGVARFAEDHWEVRTKGGDWHAYPPGAVLRAPREVDVQREQKKRAKEVHKSGDLDARVNLARWMADEGLVTEALKEADSILDLSPHHTGTLRFLSSRRFIVLPSLDVSGAELSQAKEKLYRWASNVPAAARELAINELDDLEDKPAVHADLLEGLGNFSIRRRAFSAHALGRLFPGQDARRLLQHSVLDTSKEVRRQTAQALKNADQPGLIVPVVRALDSSNIRVRVQAAEALGYMGYRAAVEPLVSYLASAQSSGSSRGSHAYYFHGKQVAYVQDFDVEVATFQAVADPQINVLLEGEVLEARILGVVEYSYVTESRAARGSLGRLTGAKPGNTGSAWQRWWKENQAEWSTRVQSSDGK